MNLRGKLARLEMPSAPSTRHAPVKPDELAIPQAPSEASTPTREAELASPQREHELASPLDELRNRMRAILERTAITPRKLEPVDTPELPFVTHDTPKGPLHLRAYRLAASHRMGRVSLLPARHASPELLALLALDPQIASCDPMRALYIDTETTGLAGGAGTVAFLIGLAFWDGEPGSINRGLMVEQILVRALGEEAPMLEHVAQRIREASMLVSYNGKSFDLPLIRTRFVMARVQAPVEPPHFDLLHVARRLHRARLKARGDASTCKLTTLERLILGFERHDDVPSADVSAHYLHFLRTGETKALLGVVEHNAWDVLAMAALLGLYGEPLESSELGVSEIAAVARTMKRAGAVDRALETAELAMERALALPRPDLEEPLRARAEIAKARGDRARALADYTHLAESVDDPRARLELAKLYEHFVKDIPRALELALSGTGEKEAEQSKRAGRLTRKIAQNRAKSRG
ncbi:MAG: ribonuclease H-like domain-containing protein [Polyangiaceae bacterium]